VGQQIPQYSPSGQLIGYLDSETGIATSLSGKPADSGASTSVATQVGNSNSYVTPVTGTTNGAPPGAVSYETIPGYPGWSFWTDANGKSLGSTGPQGQFQQPAKVGSPVGQFVKNTVGTTINALGGNVAPGTNGPPGAPGTPESGTTGFSIPTAAKQLVNSLGAGGVVSAAGNALSGGGNMDLSALQNANAVQSGMSAQLNTQALNYQPYAAPTAQAQQAQAAMAQQQAPIQYGTVSAPTAQAAQIAQTALAMQGSPVQAVNARAGVAAPTNLGPTALAGATQMAPTAQADHMRLADPALATAANMDLTDYGQDRGVQQRLAGSLEDTIAGKNPSVASIMMRQGTDNAVANQYALAQAANGMNAGAAQRQAMIGAAGLNQNEIMQQALLRAQEIQGAQGQLGSLGNAMSGQDIGVAGQRAGLQQQATLANQGAINTQAQTQYGGDIQTQLANAGFTNTANMNQAQLSQAVQLANAGFRNTATTTQAQLDQATQALNANLNTQVSLGNANNNLAAQTTTAGLANQVALANAAAQNTTAGANAGYQNATNLANASNQLAAGTTNANNSLAANTSSANLANQVALANANNATQTSNANAQLGTQASINNANTQLGTNTLNSNTQNNLTQNSLVASGQAGTSAAAEADAQAKMAQAAATKQAGLLGAGAAALAAL
jgi:hypothetical protein